MKQAFLVLLCCVIKVHGSHFNLENAFEDAKMDECPVVYHSNEPVRDMGVPFRIANTNTSGTSQLVNSGTTAHNSLLIRQPNASQYNIPQYNIPPNNIQYNPPYPRYIIPPTQPSPYPPVGNLTRGAFPPHPNPNLQGQIYRLTTDPSRNLLVPSNLALPTGPPPNRVPIRSSNPMENYSPPKISRELEVYVFREVGSYNFRKSNRKNLIRKLIVDIAKNDYASYKANENAFIEEFGVTYTGLKIGGVNYVHHYIIYFGATNFAEVIKSRPKSRFDAMDMDEAFKNLINNKPMDTLITIFGSLSVWLLENEQKIVCDLIRAKYPKMHPLDYLFFELPRSAFLSITPDSFKIFKAPTEEEKLAELKNFLIRHQNSFEFLNHFGLKSLLMIPSMYPELFQGLPDGCKMFLAKIAVIMDDLEALVQIVQLDGNILLMNFNGDLTLFLMAVRFSKKRIVPLMINLVPELATAPQAPGKNSIYKMVIIDDNLEMIQCFEEAGFSSEAKVLDGRNTVQVAFELGVPKLITHFIETLERDLILDYLVEVYGSVSEIINHATKKFNPNFVAIIREKLKI